jgi:hypothetical protein
MGWSGGNYSKGNSSTGGWVGDASLGIGIEAGRHDTQDNDFATGINQCVNKDGSNAFTGNANLNNNRIISVATATARTDAPQVAQVQDGDFIWLGTTAGTATAMTASATPAITAYKAGQKFRMLTGTASTGTNLTGHTLNVNGLGAKSVKTSQGSIDCTIGDWLTGSLLELVYDGTTFRVNNAAGGWSTWTSSLTPSAGTASSVSFSHSTYQKYSRICHVQCLVTWTQNTTAAQYIDIRLPIDSFYGTQTMTSNGFVGANIASGIGIIASAGTVLRVYNYNVSNFSIGANQIIFGGTYMTA